MRELESRKLKTKRKQIDVVWSCVEILRAGISDRACWSGHSGAVPLPVRRRIAGDSKLRGMDIAGGDA
jgi:hypothetical protein